VTWVKRGQQRVHRKRGDVNYKSISDNPVTKYVLFGVGIAVFLLVTAKLVLVTAVVLQLVLLIIVAVYLSKRFDAMWTTLEEDVDMWLSDIRKEVADLHQEVRELHKVREASAPAPAYPRATATRSAASRAQPGPTPVSAIFREWE